MRHPEQFTSRAPLIAKRQSIASSQRNGGHRGFTNDAGSAKNVYNCSMSTPLLATKLYIPPPRPNAVPRTRLIARLNEGLHRKLTLIAAPAGFGKTTLVGAWVALCGRQVAWLSLDNADNDPTRYAKT